MTLYNLKSARGVVKERCAICGTKNNLVIDHDHRSKLIRGVLCGKCNPALGMFRDSPRLLKRAAKYLQRARQEAIDYELDCYFSPSLGAKAIRVRLEKWESEGTLHLNLSNTYLLFSSHGCDTAKRVLERMVQAKARGELHM